MRVCEVDFETIDIEVYNRYNKNTTSEVVVKTENKDYYELRVVSVDTDNVVRCTIQDELNNTVESWGCFVDDLDDEIDERSV